VRQTLRTGRAAAILFSVIMAAVQGLIGLVAGSFLWDRFGSPQADETTSESVGILAFWVFAILGGCGCLWKFWPRAKENEAKLGAARAKAERRDW
jgi:hypothetical protein